MTRAHSPRLPLVSVLIPTFNYARFLPQAIESVLAQDYPHFELLVSDDASTDTTAGTLASYRGADPRLRIHQHPRNLGMVAHWNWCLQQARGRYVQFLFGDDAFCSRQALSKLVALLERHPRAVVASCARRVIDADSRAIDLWNPLGRVELRTGRDVIGRCFRANQNLIGEPSAVLLRRDALHRGFAAGYRQLVDLELWLHLLETGDLAHTPDPLVAFRRHDAQQSRVNFDSAVAQLETLQLMARFIDTRERRAAAGLSEFDYRLIQFRAMHYLRKAGRRHPPCLGPATELAQQLPSAWRFACQVRHALQRPLENLGHSLRKRRATLELWPEGGGPRATLS